MPRSTAYRWRTGAGWRAWRKRVRQRRVSRLAKRTWLYCKARVMKRGGAARKRYRRRGRNVSLPSGEKGGERRLRGGAARAWRRKQSGEGGEYRVIAIERGVAKNQQRKHVMA